MSLPLKLPDNSSLTNIVYMFGGYAHRVAKDENGNITRVYKLAADIIQSKGNRYPKSKVHATFDLNEPVSVFFQQDGFATGRIEEFLTSSQILMAKVRFDDLNKGVFALPVARITKNS